MKIIFLDMDGVMNTHLTPTRTNDKGHLVAMDQEKVFAFNKLIDRHDGAIQVVLSSAWRYDPSWRDVMKSQGFVFEFLDKTPDFNWNTGRGSEIQAWLDAHPEVQRYAIIDDDTSMHDHQLPNFFRCYWGIGVTEKMLQEVESHLMKT